MIKIVDPAKVLFLFLSHSCCPYFAARTLRWMNLNRAVNTQSRNTQSRNMQTESWRFTSSSIFFEVYMRALSRLMCSISSLPSRWTISWRRGISKIVVASTFGKHTSKPPESCRDRRIENNQSLRPSVSARTLPHIAGMYVQVTDRRKIIDHLPVSRHAVSATKTRVCQD